MIGIGSVARLGTFLNAPDDAFPQNSCSTAPHVFSCLELLAHFQYSGVMAGFIYILVNRALPDLVKVGKTTTSPEQRTEELSSSTGVPQKIPLSPFYYDLSANAGAPRVN